MMISVSTTPVEFKQNRNNQRSFGFVFEENLGREIMIVVRNVYEKLRFQSVSRPQ